MKALTTQIAERKTWLLENKKCVNADFKALTFYRENGELDEEKTLSAINKYAAGKGFQESTHRVVRNNGAQNLSKSVTDRVARTAKEMHCSIREASIFLGLPDPGPSEQQSTPSAVSELAARWRKYSPFLSESDCQTLARKGVTP